MVWFFNQVEIYLQVGDGVDDVQVVVDVQFDWQIWEVMMIVGNNFWYNIVVDGVVGVDLDCFVIVVKQLFDFQGLFQQCQCMWVQQLFMFIYYQLFIDVVKQLYVELFFQIGQCGVDCGL